MLVFLVAPYPKWFKNYENFVFEGCENENMLYEYPISVKGKYTVGPPGPFRVIFGRDSAQEHSGPFCGVLYHPVSSFSIDTFMIQPWATEVNCVTHARIEKFRWHPKLRVRKMLVETPDHWLLTAGRALNRTIKRSDRVFKGVSVGSSMQLSGVRKRMCVFRI